MASVNRHMAKFLGKTSNDRGRSDNTALNTLPNGWTATLSGNDMIIQHNGTAKVKIASTGEVTSVHDIGAYGSI